MTYDLSALKDALAKMTPGEWQLRYHPHDPDDCIVQAPRLKPHHPYDVHVLGEDKHPDLYPPEQYKNDAAGIVALKNAAPTLIADHLALQAKVAELEAEVARLRKVLTRLRDCDWVISLPDRMDAVRDIARAALGDQP